MGPVSLASFSRACIAGVDFHIFSKQAAGDNFDEERSSWSITHPTLTLVAERGITQNHLFSRRTITVSDPSAPPSVCTPAKWPKMAIFLSLGWISLSPSRLPVKLLLPLASTTKAPSNDWVCPVSIFRAWTFTLEGPSESPFTSQPSLTSAPQERACFSNTSSNLAR